MKVCKRETFLYWCVHCFIWIVIALPTLVFVLRASHPHHGPTFRLNDANGLEQRTSTENLRTPIADDEEIEHVSASIFFTKYHSACMNLLRKVLFVEKWGKCGFVNKTCLQRRSNNEDHEYLVNSSRTFCENCSKYSLIRSNASLEGERYKWLENLACLSFDVFFKGKQVDNKTGRDAKCSDPLVKDENGTCRIPCDWSLMSSSLRKTYYGVMVVNMWAALIATLITVATLASFKMMRTFPHIVRFYILICSALYATASLLPLRIGLAKVYCGTEKFWHEDGHTSKPTVLEGVLTHYFFIAFCFWSLCYVANTYSVIVRHVQSIFIHQTKYHAIQFSVCSTLPALLVGINIAAKPPGYKSLFLDRMTSVFTSSLLEYITFTLPVQISLGVAISLLWSMVHFIRKVRKNKTTLQAIRPDEETSAFLNAEKQFTKLAALFVITVAVVLSSELVITYRNEEYIHEAEEYFECLKISKECREPGQKIFFLSSVKISGPGLFCLLNFFLLFFNKDTRNVWKRWLTRIRNTLMCRWDKTDGKEYSSNYSATSGRSQSAENAGSRTRSSTIDTNASINSLGRLAKIAFPPAQLSTNKLLQVEMSSFPMQKKEKALESEFSSPTDAKCLLSPTLSRSLSDNSSEK